MLLSPLHVAETLGSTPSPLSSLLFPADDKAMDAAAGKLKDMSAADKKNLFLYHVNQPARPVPSGESYNTTAGPDRGWSTESSRHHLSERAWPASALCTLNLQTARSSFLSLSVCHCGCVALCAPCTGFKNGDKIKTNFVGHEVSVATSIE